LHIRSNLLGDVQHLFTLKKCCWYARLPHLVIRMGAMQHLFTFNKCWWRGQGVVFAVVGFAAALVGTVMSNGLIALRSRLDKNFKSQNKPPNVVLNAGTWAAHMGISSNLRYQMINGLDTVRYHLVVCTCLYGACTSLPAYVQSIVFARYPWDKPPHFLFFREHELG
jgi:hypothetical protein